MRKIKGVEEGVGGLEEKGRCSYGHEDLYGFGIRARDGRGHFQRGAIRT